MPLKRWVEPELRLVGAMGISETLKIPDLSGQPLLKLFERGRWQVTPEEYNLLLPSMRLASNLLHVGMPYIATFLPSNDVFEHGEVWDGNGQRANLCPGAIALKQNPTDEDMNRASEELQDIAKYVRWQVNYEMFASGLESGSKRPFGWMGITRLIDEDRPWGEIDAGMVEVADQSSIRNGLKRRPLIIGIMGEYVSAIRDAPKPSEQHLRATFMAGITMAHEVGHAIFHQDFRSYNKPNLAEPYVGDEYSAELGFSLVSWIFSGYHPQPAKLGNQQFIKFKTPLYWDQWYTMAVTKRPLYKTLYSISIKYIQEKLSQSFWDEIGSHEKAEAREKLKPITDTNSGQTATAMLPNWVFSWDTGRPEWKDEFEFRLNGYRTGDAIQGLSEAEIEHQKARQPDPESALQLSAGARPTVTEMLEQVGERALRLDRMVQAGGRLLRRSLKAPQRATSGLEMLGEVEDYEDNVANRRKRLHNLTNEAQGNRQSPPGSSHMADLFHSIGKRLTS